MGPERADQHAAIVASTVANALRGKKGRAYKPEDFIPKWDRGAPDSPRPEQTDDEQLSMLHRLNKAMGGRTRQKIGGDANGDTG